MGLCLYIDANDELVGDVDHQILVATRADTVADVARPQAVLSAQPADQEADLCG